MPGNDGWFGSKTVHCKFQNQVCYYAALSMVWPVIDVFHLSRSQTKYWKPRNIMQEDTLHFWYGTSNQTDRETYRCKHVNIKFNLWYFQMFITGDTGINLAKDYWQSVWQQDVPTDLLVRIDTYMHFGTEKISKLLGKRRYSGQFFPGDTESVFGTVDSDRLFGNRVYLHSVWHRA
jgi:hypothetical protein